MRAVTVGEIMMRLQPGGRRRFLQAESYDVCFGGGEANVAVSLAGFGIDARFVSKLPRNPLGEACVRDLASRGVDVSFIARGPGRMGLYFVEKGACLRPSEVLYDRAGSAFAGIETRDVDIEKALDGASWFHFSGITPALGAKPLAFLKAMLEIAAAKRIPVSCDLNYRSRLWTKEQAEKTMSGLMEHVDVLIGNEEDARDVFGVSTGDTDVSTSRFDIDGYERAAETLIGRFGFRKVAFTLRGGSSADENDWSGLLCDGSSVVRSRQYKLRIVDRIGGGDAFAAGLICAFMKGRRDREAVELAAAAAAWKHTVEGDFNVMSEGELLKLAEEGGGGRVRR